MTLVHMPHVATVLRVVSTAAVFAMTWIGTQSMSAADDVKPLSTGVRVAGVPAVPGTAMTPTAMTPTAMMETDAATGPTTPSGRLPQYQLDHWHRVLPTEAELADPRLRFILALPSGPLLMEALITIDGVSFRQVRENRIKTILADLEKPRPVEVVPQELVETVELTTTPPSADPAAVATSQEATTEEVTKQDVTPQEVPAESELPTAGLDEAAVPGSGGETEPTTEPAEPEAPQVNPPTVAAYSRPGSAVERLRRHVEATGEKVSDLEVRWLLTNWVDGPSLLMLQNNFQRFRAGERPAFLVLDRDRDGLISPTEISECVKSFRECDFNKNDVIEYTELERVATDPRYRGKDHVESCETLFLIPTAANAAVTYRRLAARYRDNSAVRFDTNSNGRFDDEELEAMRAGQVDLQLTIEFDTTNPASSRITVGGVGESCLAAVAVGTVGEQWIAVELGGAPIVFSAVQGPASDQISIGSVTDGYPILPVIDPRPDGRFTIRELRELHSRLATLDRNQDGAISGDESQAAIRICFGLGAVVHSELAGLRSLAPPVTTPPTAGPSWFVRMDRNKDNDLSRSEFPGNDEQFAVLDTDADSLVSAEEALEFDRKTVEPANDPDPADQPAAVPDPARAQTPQSTTEPGPTTEPPAAE